MDCFSWIWNLVWNILGRTPLPLHEVVFQAPKKINDYVYEVCTPKGTPSVEIVFFHGLQLDHMSSKDAHIMTWVSRDKSELWLKWLLQDFPNSRILTICYDASPRKTNKQGIMDMYITRENLLHSFIGGEAKIGQHDCPVMLVGHCLGGLVMKELCVLAYLIFNQNQPDEPHERVENFLENVRGLFTYATPHNGLRLADNGTSFQKGSLLEDLKTLNAQTARRNEDFRKLRKDKTQWKTFGVGESHNTTLGRFTGILVPEASARHEVDRFITIPADHFNVCRPVSRECSGYQALSGFITDALKEGEQRLPTGTDLFPGFEIVGVEDRVKQILEKLVQAPRLALVGFGGMGKTTLAKVIFHRISQNYDYVCFLDEVKSVMGNGERRKDLRDAILKGLKRKGRTRHVDSSFSWNRLKEKKVLIVLDDAESQSHVQVMTAEDGFSKESHVIVTSRDAGFLRPHNFEIYRVDGLGLDDSKRLFCMHAFKKAKAPRGHEERVRRFVEKCGGFPLALRVTGSYLYKREEGVWDDAMKKLSLAKPLDGKEKDELWYFLRISYDSLAESEKQMFLDAATCFHGKKLRDVQEAWRWCSWASAAAESGWENLLDRCLVSKTRRWDEEIYISMHEVLRDMGRAIAGNGSMVVDFVGEARKLQTQLLQDKATLKVLIIDIDKDLNTSLLSNDLVLSGMEKLEILWLRGVNLSCVELQLQALRQLKVEYCLRSSRISLLKKFRLQQLQALESLEIVCGDSVPESHVHKLSTDLTELADSVGKLGALRSLNIEKCRSLRTLPNTLGQLHNLEHLRIYGCDSLIELPKSTGQLRALQSLKIERCMSFTTLPNNLRELQALKLLHISCFNNLTTLPESLSQLRALQELEIYCPALEVVPNLGQLGALKKLTIYGCNKLRWLPESICQLRSLTHLKIDGCESLEGLPNSFGKLDALEELTIQFCDKLTMLPGSVGQLCALRRLIIEHCDFLKVLPNSIGELQALEELKVRYCRKLAIIPESIGQLRALHTLQIVSCWGLKKFLITSGDLPALETLIIRYCRRLVVFPESIAQLRALRHLEIIVEWENDYQYYCLENSDSDSKSDGNDIHSNQRRQLEVLETLPDTLRKLRSLEKVSINSHLGVVYRTTFPKSVEVDDKYFKSLDNTDSDLKEDGRHLV